MNKKVSTTAGPGGFGTTAGGFGTAASNTANKPFGFGSSTTQQQPGTTTGAFGSTGTGFGFGSQQNTSKL